MQASFLKKIICAGLAFLTLFAATKAKAISLDDIQLWAGSGTNRAGLVIEWNSPQVLNQTTVPAPAANKTMAWGFRFNGTATGTEMLDAIVVADAKLYFVLAETNGTSVDAIGYNLNGNGNVGVTDGTKTNYFANGLFTNVMLTTSAIINVDAATPVNSGDLFWSGYYGPAWRVWTEAGDSGGFYSSPNRGSSAYWNPSTQTQGQWAYATNSNLNALPLTNGSWIGFSVAAAGYPTNSADPNYNTDLNIFTNDEQAPPSPDGTYVAYVPNTNDFAVQVMNATNLGANLSYGDPTAMLGQPTLQFYDPYDGSVTDRVSIIDPPYYTTPAGNNDTTEIESGGEVTVKMGRKVYANPDHPYSVDLIVYGNSFFDSLSGAPGGFVSDATDLSTVGLNNDNSFGHQAIISVSQDGTTWYTLTNMETLFPTEAYRWDDTNSSWTAEEMNANKPIEPYLYTNNFGGETVANVLDKFAGASGGSDYSLQQTGLPWIQYVRLQPTTTNYDVIDAIAAVNPAVVGEALSIAPDDIASGTTNLFFQRADNCGQNQIFLGFNYVNGVARISTVNLSDFSPFAPVAGDVSSAYQIQSLPVAGTSAVAFNAQVGLRAGDNYSGNGSDLRVFEWNGTNWLLQPFSYNGSNNEVVMSGVTNFSAFVVSQIVQPHLSIQMVTNGFAFQFTPVPNCQHVLERSTNLMNWMSIATNTPTSPKAITLLDTNTPSGKAFYRVQVNVP